MSRMSDYQIDVCELKREELIADETTYLLGQGRECDPFSRENFGEALQNFSDEALEHIKERCEEVRYPYLDGPTPPNRMEMLGNALYCATYEYWEKIAEAKARVSVPSVDELHEDCCAEQLDARMDAAKDARMGL